MNRIIDANLNRTNEALRVLEEISRFILNDKKTSETLKNIRHALNNYFDKNYENLINSRDTKNDVGTNIKNPDSRLGILSIFKANIKRAQEGLRVLSEYGKLDDNLRYQIYELEKEIYEKLQKYTKHEGLFAQKLYLVTNSDNFKSENDFLNAIAGALAGGIRLVQYREKNKTAREIIKTGEKIRTLCFEFGAIFIVNDRIDIAQILGADGVHLGQDDISILHAREILGNGKIIGISTHNIKQAQEAIAQGADYIGVGPCYETPTKKTTQRVEADFLNYVAQNVEIPYFAIGGVNKENIKELKNIGLKRFALVRAIMNSKNPTSDAQEIISLI